MSHLKIVHLDRATIGPAISLDKPNTAHEWVSYDTTSASDVIDRLKQADIAVLNKVAITADMLAQLPHLKMIAISATGFDKIDIAACRDRQIVVSNITGYAKQSVPEHTFALILSLRRAIKGYSADVANGMWQTSGQFCFFSHPIHDLHNTTLGLIGTGSIGTRVQKIAEAFGMKIIKAARKDDDTIQDGYVAFDTLLAESDIISLHCPLTPQTKDLIAAKEFAKMAKKPLLINTSRGGLVNETDLITALDKGQIAGAGFDVVTTEPPADDHIFMTQLDRPNFILTPHTAWASDEAMQILWTQLIGHIDAFAAGTPTNNLTA
ncbi:MAG: D-2-hydroxyacid dehydrogenase [Candidatus Puniceispirillaceae bacterium]